MSKHIHFSPIEDPHEPIGSGECWMSAEDNIKIIGAIMVEHAVNALTQADVFDRHFDGLDTYYRKPQPLSIPVTRDQEVALNAHLDLIGEPRTNVIPSLHAHELGWLNGWHCELPFCFIAEMMGGTSENFRKALCKQRLQVHAPAGVIFRCEGPMALIVREEAAK